MAPVKSDGGTTSSQYYLAIPAKDKIEEEKTLAEEFAYNGDALNAINAEGAAFGMWTPQEGTTATRSGGKVQITYIPKKTTYVAFYLDADITDENSWKTKIDLADGKFTFEVDESYCGYAWPVAPVKSDGGTTSSQYYLAIPAKDKIEEEQAEEPEEKIELAVTNETGMFKVASAYLEEKDGKKELVASLNGSSYNYLFVGTYEDAVANGDGRGKNWLEYSLNEKGKKTFRIPVVEGQTFYPIVSVSNSYLEKYDKGENAIERAFYPRQFILNIDDKSLITNDYNVQKELSITNNVPMFKPSKGVLETIGGPNSNTYAENLIITMGSDSFDAVYIGTTDKAKEAQASIAINNRQVIIPVKDKIAGEAFITAWHSASKNDWYERKITVNKVAGTLVFDAVTEEDKKDEESGSDKEPEGGQNEDGSQDTLDGTTGAVDNSTILPDGVYTPDSFSYSGGSGRASITCKQVTVINGQAFATIAFSSSNYGYVKASGQTYYPTIENGVSTFTIPIALNQNNTIIGMTTAMSQAHEVNYTLFVYIAAAAGQEAGGKTIGEDNKLDEKAPVIAGIGEGEEIKLEHAKLLKMFRYDNGCVLVEINRTKDTVLDPEKLAKEAEENKDEAAQNEAVPTEETAEAAEEEGGQSNVKTDADYAMELYQADVVKYLIVPEGVEIPAGMEKQVLVIRLPKKSVYVSSEDEAEAMESLGLLELIKATGLTEENCKNEALKNLLKDGKVVSTGEIDDVDYNKLVKAEADLVLGAGGDILPKEAEKDKKAKDYQDQYTKITERMALLNIPMLIDRSADEKDPKGQLEWLKLYGILFGKEKEADALIVKGVQ